VDEMTTGPPAETVRRVDAERNLQRILAAAREAFAELNVEVSMAEVARRAGVGSATLYRNFATRRELLEALYTNDIDALCDAAAGVDPSADGLEEWLRRFYAYFTGKRLLATELLQHAEEDAPVFGAGRTRILEAGRLLLVAAQDSGDIRDDLTIEQVIDMVAAIGNIAGDDSYRQPILQAALDALHQGQRRTDNT